MSEKESLTLAKSKCIGLFGVKWDKSNVPGGKFNIFLIFLNENSNFFLSKLN